jgi:spermidine synthase
MFPEKGWNDPPLSTGIEPRKLPALDHRFPLLLLCFLLSGFAALLYQTAWTREFSFIFGTSEIAVAVVLAGYMGGLAVGSAIAARLAPRIRRPVLAYGVLELGIALSALAIPRGLQALTAAYVAVFSHDLPTEPGALATGFRLAGAFLLMLIPTGLMGATLPLLARHAVRRDEEIGPRIGALYAINTAGAIGGTVVAAFLLLPALGLRQTVYIGALVNGVVFLAAAALARGTPAREAVPARHGAAVRRWVLPLMLLSGAVSFSYEVLWTRLLSQLLGGSLYAFATMLSSFLLGITLGSAIGGASARRVRSAAIGLALAELGVAVFGLAAFLFADQLPGVSQALGAGWRATPAANAPLAAMVLLPVALCLGATFPFAVRLIARDASDTAAATARVYAWNTVGAIVGAVATGFVLLPTLHFAGTATLGAAASLAIAAAVALLARPRLTPILGLVGIGALTLALLPIDNPWRLLVASPLTGTEAEGSIHYEASGRSSTVVLLDDPIGFRLFTNGLPESTIVKYTSTPGLGREARALTLLPALLRPELERVLVIGLGGGVAVEGVPPTVSHVDVIELEPEVVTANRKTSGLRASDPLAEPRTRVVMNDARGALMLAQRRYDAIVSQPSHPWTAGASHLYTREFFELVRSRLAPDGVFVQWIGLAFVDADLLRTLVATLNAVFPEVQLYRPHGPAILFVGSDAPLDITAGRAALAASPNHFARNGFLSIEDAVATLELDTAGARLFAGDAPPNSDDWNLLASRSARLRGGLEIPAFQQLVASFDPVAPLVAQVDAPALTRSLVRRRQLARAHQLATSLPEAEKQTGLGWIAARRGERQRAAKHFERALELDPGAVHAQAGQIALDLEAADPESLPEPATLVRQALALQKARDWEGVMALDEALARIEGGDPLFETATQLRSAWRLASGDPVRATEAIPLIDVQLAARYTSSHQIERARAAHLAGRPTEAWATLHEAIRRLPRAPARPVLRQAHALARALPEDELKPRVMAQLAARSGARRRP